MRRALAHMRHLYSWVILIWPCWDGIGKERANRKERVLHSLQPSAPEGGQRHPNLASIYRSPDCKMAMSK